MRSAECANDVLATGDAALRVNSAGEGPVSAEWMIPKVCPGSILREVCGYHAPPLSLQRLLRFGLENVESSLLVCYRLRCEKSCTAVDFASAH